MASEYIMQLVFSLINNICDKLSGAGEFLCSAHDCVVVRPRLHRNLDIFETRFCFTRISVAFPKGTVLVSRFTGVLWMEGRSVKINILTWFQKYLDSC